MSTAAPLPRHRASLSTLERVASPILFVALIVRVLALSTAAYLLIYSVVHAAPQWCEMPTASQCMTVEPKK